MENKVVAISGCPGSGKTTIAERIIRDRDDFVYFDFGSLFRPLTYYLIYDLGLNEEEIKELKVQNKIRDYIKISTRIVNNKVEIGINDNFYNHEELNTIEMDKMTVVVGGIIDNYLSEDLREIITNLKKDSNVLLNARRPVIAYPELDRHIFLTADFDERSKRKSILNNVPLDEAIKSLRDRDAKEEKNGFFEKFSFTKVIDTTNKPIEQVLELINNEINSTCKITKLGNITLVLGSYSCNKNCPYCIAKNNQKFISYDQLNKLNNILSELSNYGFSFERFVLSGNGEPSKYSIDDLQLILDSLNNNSELFKVLRVHSSGNIFDEKDKFDLFNNSNIPVEYEILRVAFDSDIDRYVLDYDVNYLEKDTFKKNINIKCDIALTDYLEKDNIKESLNEFLRENPSISKIRLKKLMVGDNDTTKQAMWVKEHTLNEEEINKIIYSLDLIKKDDTYTSIDGKIIYKPTGDYENDLVINNGEIKDYNNKVYTLTKLRGKYGNS